MQKRRFTNKLFAGLLSALTALSPAVSALPVYAASDNDTDGIDITTGVDTGISVTDTSDTKKVSIEVDGSFGELIVDEGKETEQTVRVSESDDTDSKKASVTDANGQVTEAEVNSENPYALVLTREAGTTVTVEAKADTGFEVAQYSILMDSGAEEKTEFKTDNYSAFTYDLKFDADKTVKVGFGKAPEGVTLVSNTDDAIVIEKEDDIQVDVEKEEEDITIEKETETKKDEADDNQIVIESETPADTFVSVYLGDEVAEDELNVSDFASMRLVVLTDGEFTLVNEGDVIGHYGNTYLLEFTSIQQTMNAYVYYKDKVLAVEPDKTVESATEKDSDEIVILNDTPIDVDAEANPLNMLDSVQKAADAAKNDGVIALIDTGASESDNVIGQVSVIDDVLAGENDHADKMVDAIVSQNENAKILSIRAIGDKGLGTVSSLVAAMQYAMDQKVSMINLSLYVRANLSSSVLQYMIDEATEAGIIVVGAAGNDGVNVADYIPGSVESAYVIGACDANGKRVNISNFGKTVDYNVVAETTSEATALFTGFVSANGLDAVAGVLNQDLIFATDYEGDNGDIDVTPGEPSDVPDYSDFDNYERVTDRLLLAKYTMADVNAIEDGDDLESLSFDNPDLEDGDYFAKVVGNSSNYVDLYDAGDGTYKFKLDVPFVNSLIVGDYLDYDFAYANDDGELITDGVSFDVKTGIGSIDLSVFRDEDEFTEYDFGDIQIQVLMAVDKIPNNQEQVITFVDSNGKESQIKNAKNVGLDDMNVCLAVQGADGSVLTADDFSVYLNGQMVQEPISYDSEKSQIVLRGCLTSFVSSIRVVMHKDVEYLVRVAKNPWDKSVLFWLHPSQYKNVETKLPTSAHIQAYEGVSMSSYWTSWTDTKPTRTIPGKGLSDHAGKFYVYPNNKLSTFFMPISWGGVDWTPYKRDGKTKMGATSSIGGKTYVAGISAWCVHVAVSKSPEGLRTSALGSRLTGFDIYVDKRESDGVYYIKIEFGCTTSRCGTGNRKDNQRSYGSFVVAVKQDHIPIKLTKAADTSCKLIYKHGNVSEGLLSPYANLKAKFGIYKVNSSGKPTTRIGNSFWTNVDGSLTLPANHAVVKQLELNKQYALVEETPPANYLNNHSKASGGIPFVYKKTNNNTCVISKVVDKAIGDPRRLMLVKSPRSSNGIVLDAMEDVDFSDVRYRLDYFEPGKNTATYTFELKPYRFTNGMWIVDIGNPSCYVSPKSTYSFLLAGMQVAFPVGRIVLTETQASIGFDVHPPRSGSISYNNGTNPVTGGPLFAWDDNVSFIIGLNPDDRATIGHEQEHYIALRVDKEMNGSNAVIEGTSLAGIEFTFYNDDAWDLKLKDGRVIKPGGAIMTVAVQGDTSGWYAQTDAVLPINRTYRVKETKGNAYYPITDTTEITCKPLQKWNLPNGYVLNMSKVGDYVKEEHTFNNEPLFGGVTVQKIDYLKQTDDDHGNANLAGAEFTVVAGLNFSLQRQTDGNLLKIPGICTTVKGADPNHITPAHLNPVPEYTYDEIKAAIPKSKCITITTDKNGNAISASDALSWGNYYVIETKAPAGYQINKEYIGKLEIREENKITKPKNIGRNMNKPSDDVQQEIYAGGLKVKKLDYMRDSDEGHGDTDLRGTQFTIVNAGDASAVNYQHKEIKTSGLKKYGTNVTYAQVAAFAKDPSYVMEVLTTDAKGNAQTSKHSCSQGDNCEYTRRQKESLPYGTYYVIETTPPTGYLLNTNWVGMVTVTADGTVYTPTTIQNAEYHRSSNHELLGIPDGDAYACRNQIYRSGISVEKIDREMNDATWQGDGELRNAEFTIVNASEHVVRNYQDKDIPTAKSKLSANPTWDELDKIGDEHTVQVIRTDRNGRATTGKQTLPYGTYYIYESKAPKGYFLNENFVGKIVIREDNVMTELPENAGWTVKSKNAFWDINNAERSKVDEQVRRNDLHLLKVNIDGEYKKFIPFLVSMIKLNEDGSETVLESHVMVCDKNGLLDTARNHSNHTNEMDQYLVGNSKISADGETHLEEAAEWGIWFQGNRNDYPKDAINDDYGALPDGFYRVTELQCEDNKGLEENLVASELIEIRNDSVKYEFPMKDYRQHENWEVIREFYGLTCGNARPYVYHPLVDTEIEMRSDAMDVESGTQTVPVREDVIVSDTVEMMHVSADHKYRLETKFVDMTTGKVLRILSTDDADTKITDDGAYLQKEFYPKKQSGTNSTHDKITISGHIDTTGLEGHVIMAYDYLYQYIDITNNDKVKGDWVHVKRHPADGEEDKQQMLYVPDLHTMAKDALTGDRVGAKSKEDKIIDTVEYMNLSKSEEYVMTMTLVDTLTGEPMVTNEDGSPKVVMTPITFRRAETPVSGKVTMPEFALDSSAFENKSATVVETLYRAAEDGTPMGEPLLVHDSILDEDQTIRWIDVRTNASDKNTKDDVGTDEDVATVYDNVVLHNVIFDDKNHDGQYSYTVRGHLVYQKDFTDADGKEHKAGETVETLDGTQDEVTITSDAAGNITFTYKDGTSARGEIVKSYYGHNVAKRVDSSRVGDNSYIQDMSAMYCDLTVELAFKVNSMKLAGGTTVVFEDLYHDSTGANTDVIVADHKDILDEGQTVHYPDIETSAEDIKTKDDVGTVTEKAKLVDTVTLTNLVPGRDYVVNGTLMNQSTGRPLLVNGKEIVQSANIHVTEDGQIVAGNGEKVTVTSFNDELHEVCGTIDLTFEFDSRLLAGETVVVFEDLIHNGIKVATHADIHDKSQSVHFPDIHTTARDVYTKDEVGTVSEKAEVIDTVTYKNLVPGRTYTISGILMNQKTDEPYLDAEGKEVRAERTFVAGEEEDGIVAEVDKEKNSVSGTVEMKFSFNGTNLEDITTVVFEDLYHNNVKVTAHADIHDKAQTIHFPKVCTSAIDVNTGDEVGVVGQTTIRDTVNLWNLVPDKDYTIKGLLFDKTTGEFLTDEDGNQIEAENPFHVNADGTVDNCCELPCKCKGGTCTCEDWAVCISDIDKDHNDSDGHANLVFKIDASELGGHDIVVYEYLYHNGVVVAKHEDVNDLGQTIHFPDIKTSAADVKTNDTTGTVEEQATVKDTVFYENLVVGREYVLKGTLMNQDTGAPIVNEDGTLVTAEAAFTVTTESSDVNKVTKYDEKDNSVSGEYVLTFTVDSTQLEGKTVVAFETLYHNGVKVVVHADIYDKAQSVHYPDIHTTAIDSSTGDHVGSIWGALVNSVRQFLGEKDADGNGIADEKQQNIIDTVTLNNLVPGYTYVVSGKLYDVDKSHESEEPVPVVIDGKEIVQAVTITVSKDGKEIIAADGSKTSVVNFDKKKNQVDGTVDLVYTLDSSKIQDTKIVVFEDLYHDSTYTPEQNPFDVKAEDIVHVHRDIDDENQSVSEVGVRTTAIDTKTENHVGVIPNEGTEEYSVIKDEVNMTKLVPEMKYTVKGVLVDINESDFAEGKVLYLKADGTLTENRKEAYEEEYTFTAENTEEIHYLNFALASDKVQGRALTVFEELYHNDVKITAHPAYEDVDKWDDVSFQNQTVYYPTGKTNATDNTTGVHTSFAGEDRVIVDRVYFENLIVGENYEIDGQLHYQEDFTDKDGVLHKAGDLLEGTTAAVKFTASETMEEVDYVDREGKAKVDSLTVKKLPNGQTVVTGYVSLEFTVDASKLAGATVVAFEDFKNNDVTIFVHHNLKDLPQTVRIPEIHTNAKVGDLDEASVYDENGEFKDVVIVDTVTYKNIWTQAELDAMHEQGLAIEYADGTYRVEKSDIYDINEKATYIMKGVLMNKETGEPLVNVKGETYEVVSEPFSPELNSGTIDIEFVVNAKDLVTDGVDTSELEGLTVVAFETLYQAENADEIGEGKIIAVHEDIDDDEQDIRFPKVRTHVSDGIDTEKVEMTDGQMLSLEDVESLEKLHIGEKTTTSHEVFATDKIEIVDLVSVENLHGGTKYEVTGVLQVVTEYDENGVPVKFEPAKDDDGNIITSTVEFDTTALSPEYNDSVSGYVPITFTFSGVNLAGKTTVVFETVFRDGVVVGVHANIKDAPQTIYVPAIHTNATDALSGLHETLAGSQTVILDKVSYENLEAGKTYSLAGVLHKKSDGSELPSSAVNGTFVAGVDNQFIMADGTKTMSMDELKSMFGTTSTQPSWDSAVGGDTNAGTNSGSGDANLDVEEKTEYVVGRDIEAGYYKITPVDSDGTGFFGYWCIYYSKDGSVPTERTLATTLTNGIVMENEAHYIRLADNMVLQIANSVINGKANSDFVKVDAAEAESQLNSVVARYFEDLEKDAVKEPVSDKPENGVDSDTVTDDVDADNSEVTPDDGNADAELTKGNVQKRVSGDVYVVMVVDTKDLAGDTVVAFETLSTVDDAGKDKILAVHEDIDDEDQSVLLPKIQTSATIDGGKTADASTKSVVVDTVSYWNLTPGRTYQMVGTLMDKATGNSTGVTVTKEFTPDKADGTVEVTFVLDTTEYVGRSLVVFEELLTKSEDGKAYVVAQHKDITDAAQTVTVTEPPKDKVTPDVDTSDLAVLGYVIAGLSMALLLAVMIVRRKKNSQV